MNKRKATALARQIGGLGGVVAVKLPDIESAWRPNYRLLDTANMALAMISLQRAGYPFVVGRFWAWADGGLDAAGWGKNRASLLDVSQLAIIAVAGSARVPVEVLRPEPIIRGATRFQPEVIWDYFNGMMYMATARPLLDDASGHDKIFGWLAEEIAALRAERWRESTAKIIAESLDIPLWPPAHIRSAAGATGVLMPGGWGGTYNCDNLRDVAALRGRWEFMIDEEGGMICP